MQMLGSKTLTLAIGECKMDLGPGEKARQPPFLHTKCLLQVRA